MFRPRKKYQGGGPVQSDYPDFESWQRAYDEYLQSLSPKQEKMDFSNTWTNFPPLSGPGRPVNPSPGNNIDISAQTGYVASTDGGNLNNNPGIPRTPNDKSISPKLLRPKVDPHFVLQGLTSGAEWLANAVDRNRQNNYASSQYSTLGQMDPLPVSNFQPNPINPGSAYAKKGGMLRGKCNPRHRGKPKDMDEDMDEDEMKKGGLTPNKARKILHDGTVHGKPLTDKQRRFFGANSKGNTLKYAGGGWFKNNI